MHIDNVKSLILSKFAYTKFSEKPLLVLPWVLAPALFSKSIYISAFSWIGVFVIYAAVDFLFSLFPWKEIPRDDYPAIKRRYSRISVFLKIIKYPTSIIFATIIAANLLYPH